MWKTGQVTAWSWAHTPHGSSGGGHGYPTKRAGSPGVLIANYVLKWRVRRACDKTRLGVTSAGAYVTNVHRHRRDICPASYDNILTTYPLRHPCLALFTLRRVQSYTIVSFCYYWTWLCFSPMLNHLHIDKEYYLFHVYVPLIGYYFSFDAYVYWFTYRYGVLFSCIGTPVYKVYMYCHITFFGRNCII